MYVNLLGLVQFVSSYAWLPHTLESFFNHPLTEQSFRPFSMHLYRPLSMELALFFSKHQSPFGVLDVESLFI